MLREIVIYRIKENERETDIERDLQLQQRRKNRVLFFSRHSYTFVTSRSILSFFLFFSSILLIRLFLLFPLPTVVINQSTVLLTHSSTINLLFTGRCKPSFLLRHDVPPTLLRISSITLRCLIGIHLVLACSQLVSKLVCSHGIVFSSTHAINPRSLLQTLAMFEHIEYLNSEKRTHKLLEKSYSIISILSPLRDHISLIPLSLRSSLSSSYLIFNAFLFKCYKLQFMWMQLLILLS